MFVCRLLIVAAVVAALLNPLSVGAATVSHRGGVVLVSSGDSFAPIAGSVEMAPGSRVMVRPGGSATITYGLCTVHVGSGMWLVQEAAPCAPGITEIDFTTKMSGGAIDPPPPPPPRDHLVIGGAIAGGAIIACLASWCRDRDRPASP